MSSTKVKQRINYWDAAITEARKGIDRLQTAINVFEKKKAAGEPWPKAKKAATQN